MYKKIRESVPWLVVGFVLLGYGGFEFIRLDILPHVKNVVGKIGG